MTLLDEYLYPAVFTYAEDGISIEFPDLPGCLPCAHTDAEAFHHASEALSLHLWSMEQDGDPIPEPTQVDQVPRIDHQTVMLIRAWMPPVREQLGKRSVKKTLTIPQWLDELATKENVNFSRLLQESLKQYLGVDDSPR